MQQETSKWYHITCNVVYYVLGGTLLRPIVGAVPPIPNSTTLHNVPCLCARIQEKFWSISSWSSTATSAVKMA